MSTAKRELTIEEYERLFKLTPFWRGTLAVCAFLISCFAGVLYCTPPGRQSEKIVQAKSHIIQTTSTAPADPSNVVIALFAGGIALLAYAATGIKITTFRAFGIEGSAPLPPGRNDVPPIEDPAKQTPATSGKLATPTSYSALTTAQIVELKEKYPGLQFGEDPVHTFLLRSSWNGLRVLKACQIAARTKRPFNLRQVAHIGTEMSYDYAFGYLIASCSAGVVVAATDAATGLVTVYEVHPTLDDRIDEIVSGNVPLGPVEAVNAKRRDFSALRAYLDNL